MTEHPEAVPLRTTPAGDRAALLARMADFAMDNGGRLPPLPPGCTSFRASETVLLSAEEALTLANRLVRVANLILESEEDRPDIERDMARFAAAAEEAPE
jgi:hypothetical protein